ncbi:MAG: glycosyltransferase, partial [Planctomycetota bacterium]
FPLGADLAVAQGNVRAEVQSLFAGEATPYLTVAAFDPRKNHGYLLDAFTRWWKSGSKQKLCLVGRMGSKCCEIHRRVTKHPEFGNKLFLFQDLSDAELHHAYGRARGVIFPSFVEGYGLPIAESLWFGNRTFASDIPVHREVGRDSCSYFDLDDPSDLVHLLDTWERELTGTPDKMVQRVRTPSHTQPLSWSESCRQFLDTCFQQLDAAPLAFGQSPHTKDQTQPSRTLNKAA